MIQETVIVVGRNSHRQEQLQQFNGRVILADAKCGGEESRRIELAKNVINNTKVYLFIGILKIDNGLCESL